MTSRKYEILVKFENTKISYRNNSSLQPPPQTLYLIEVHCTPEEYKRAGLTEKSLNDISKEECRIRFILCGKEKIPLKKKLIVLKLKDYEYTFVHKGEFKTFTIPTRFVMTSKI